MTATTSDVRASGSAQVPGEPIDDAPTRSVRSLRDGFEDYGALMPEWEQPEPSVYECEVWFLAETAGGYSAFAAYLPGVVSQGETEEEALRELSEAIHAALESYRARGRKTPWSEEPIDLEGAEPTLKKWVLVSG